jgi:hypothetical protein
MDTYGQHLAKERNKEATQKKALEDALREQVLQWPVRKLSTKLVAALYVTIVTAEFSRFEANKHKRKREAKKEDDVLAEAFVTWRRQFCDEISGRLPPEILDVVYEQVVDVKYTYYYNKVIEGGGVGEGITLCLPSPKIENFLGLED